MYFYRPMKRVVFLFTFYLLTLSDLFSRAGGGGGHSSGGGGGHFGGGYYYGAHGGTGHKWNADDTRYLVIILCCIVLGAFIIWNAYKWLIRYRSFRANMQLQRSAQADKAWNKEQLIPYIEQVYFKMQEAWTKQDMRLAQGLVTAQLQNKFQFMLNRQRRMGIYNYTGDIKIANIKIVGLEDYLDNRMDNFTAYISGSMLDVMVRHKRKPVKEEEACEFEDLYYFVRHNDQWLVSEVSNMVDLWTIAELKILAES
jgi:hypothetical protein